MDLDRLSQFSPKIIFSFESDGFVVKTAKTVDDLKQALQLRHAVFLEEGLNRKHESGLEFDSFDHRADHLMIINKAGGYAVGTYRLIHSDFSNIFYSQGEFHMDDFLNREGTKLELGRACTHAEHRTGRTMDLLWQGLSHYIRETRTRFLFGCSSLPSTDPQWVFSVVKSLQEKGNLNLEWKIEPTSNYQFPDAQQKLAAATVDPGILRTLPPLLRSYLHAGSQVFGMPALDRDFACADLFTILDLTKLNKKFAERYNPLGSN
jgi:putative hemolysin